MARRNIDRQALRQQIQELDIDNELKSQLLDAVSEQKKYGLVWENHKEDAEELLREKIPVFVEDDALRLNDGGESAPNHILIEGDNLHALTALTYTHEGKVDVIYIDPPYNTGNKDFVYNDSFVDSEDGYRHSKWLSFMEKRLRIAKKLLSDRGVIFISIDDNEDAQLKLLCDDIFGNKNKIADVIWQSRKSVSNDTFVSMNHNYTLIYAKELNNWDKQDFRLPAKTDGFDNRDNDPRGPWVADPFDAPNIRPNLTYAIKNPNTGIEYWPPKGRCWRTTEEQYLQMLADNRIVFGKTGKSKPQLKRFLDFALSKGDTPTTVWNDIETTTDGTKSLMEIFGGEKLFTNPKPLSLINRCLLLASKEDSLILDFFAGSGTTLHATMQLNAEDGGKRQCILVTNNENNICRDVTYERNKRVINGYTTPKGVEVEGLKDNNLRYYKVDFVDRENTHKALREQAYAMTDILCIKEGVYTEMASFGSLSLEGKENMIRYFSKGEKQMLLVYDSRVIPFIAKEIAKMDASTNIKVYVFADGSYPYIADFDDVLGKVTIIAMPYAMNSALKTVLPSKNEEILEGEPENIDDND